MLKFKFYLNDKFQHEELADVEIDVVDETSVSVLKNHTDVLDSALVFNLNIPVHSSEFSILAKSSNLIGFVTPTDEQMIKYSFNTDKPNFYIQKPIVKKVRFINSSDLVEDNFLSLIKVDEQTGAVYFNPDQLSSVVLFSRMSKIINLYYQHKNLTNKLINFDCVIKNSAHSLSLKVWLNLIFNSKTENPIVSFNPEFLVHKNNFLINSNNLLNLFRNGDEFLINLEMEENSPTWPSYVEFNQADQEGFIVNLNEYFKSRLNPDKKIP